MSYVAQVLIDRDARRVLSLEPRCRTSEQLDKLLGLLIRDVSSFREFPVHMQRAFVQVATYAQ